VICLFASAPRAALSRWSPRWPIWCWVLLLWANLTIGGAQWQFQEYARNVRASPGLGIDGIALMLIMLSVFLMPICISPAGTRSKSASANIWRRSC
jgi:NADH-quinone oxidoreductase subunit M